MKKLMLLLLALMPVLLFTACSSDDGDETPAMSFDVNTITGTWEIIEARESPKWWIKQGTILRFYSNGTCKTDFSMEDSYKIEDGQVKTYYKASGEPLFAYALVSKDAGTFTVRVYDILERKWSIVIKMVKQSQ